MPGTKEPYCLEGPDEFNPQQRDLEQLGSPFLGYGRSSGSGLAWERSDTGEEGTGRGPRAHEVTGNEDGSEEGATSKSLACDLFKLKFTFSTCTFSNTCMCLIYSILLPSLESSLLPSPVLYSDSTYIGT